MLNWAQQFNIFCFLNNHQYQIQPNRYECLLAVGCKRAVGVAAGLQQLNAFAQEGHWCFGHLSYNFKEVLRGTAATKQNPVGFPPFYFFEPEMVLTLANNQVQIFAPDAAAVWQQIEAQPAFQLAEASPGLSIRQRLQQPEYVRIVQKLQEHIRRGDCYELNFCQEFFAEEATINPAAVFSRLCQESPAPFAAFYRLDNCYLLSASPERFLYKQGLQLLSQPMKGTARRNLLNPSADAALKEELAQNAKERAENIMVVDLVRNDLSQVCARASVQVDELCGVYSFPQVHQMISTVSGQLKEAVSFSELLQATFPMGSMTGAPKRRVMELIDHYEPVARGLFSGSVGYIDPAGDFDFNVVIRSILYNAAARYVSYQVGSGITFYSSPEAEWEECLLKGAALKKVLTQ